MNLLPDFNMPENTSSGVLNATDNPYAKAIKEEIKDQYMMGEDLLIAPLFTGQKNRKVIFPKGKWFDFYTGKYVAEGEVITVTPGLDIIPVYVKDGAIIPMIPPILKIGSEKLPVEIRCYGKKENTYNLYDDDGVSFDYEKGKFTRITLSVTKDENNLLKGNISIPTNATIWSYSNFTWNFMTK